MGNHSSGSHDLRTSTAHVQWKDWLIVVPARLHSTRLPRKPLADIKGKPLIVRVFDRLRPLVDAGAHVVVATDATEIQNCCQIFGIPCSMTRVEHTSGTDRCWEVASQHGHPFVMNVQGDEPFINIDDLTALAAAFYQSPKPEMATLVHKNMNAADFANPNVVKAVRGHNNFALYFSRSGVPYTRNRDPQEPFFFWQHLGVYAFQKNTLAQFCGLPPSALELRESLEQLRALDHRITIKLVEAHHPSIGVDTPEDLEAARAKF